MSARVREVSTMSEAHELARRSLPSSRDEPALVNFIYTSSRIYFGEVDGEVACVWGLIQPSLMSDRAYIWLFTTELVDQHKFLFIRMSQRWIEEQLKTYSMLSGECVLENLRAQRWLKRCGAVFGTRYSHTISFEIRRPTHG